MHTAAGSLAGRSRTIRRAASSAPADPPITIRSRRPSERFAKRAILTRTARRRKPPRRRSRPKTAELASCLPVNYEFLRRVRILLIQPRTTGSGFVRYSRIEITGVRPARSLALSARPRLPPPRASPDEPATRARPRDDLSRRQRDGPAHARARMGAHRSRFARGLARQPSNRPWRLPYVARSHARVVGTSADTSVQRRVDSASRIVEPSFDARPIGKRGARRRLEDDRSCGRASARRRRGQLLGG